MKGPEGALHAKALPRQLDRTLFYPRAMLVITGKRQWRQGAVDVQRMAAPRRIFPLGAARRANGLGAHERQATNPAKKEPRAFGVRRKPYGAALKTRPYNQ